MVKSMPYQRALRFAALPPDAPVRIYSRQTPEAWNVLKATGKLYCTPEHALEGVWGVEANGIPSQDMTTRLMRPYEWMRERMAERIEGYSGHFPIWGWIKRPSTRPKHLMRFDDAEGHVLITAIVPRGRMVLSDFDRWHDPLNNWPCLPTEASFDAWDDTNPDDPQIRREMELSWNRVLSFGPQPGEDISWVGSYRRVVVQACIDGLFLEDVVAACAITVEKDTPDAPFHNWKSRKPGTARVSFQKVFF